MLIQAAKFLIKSLKFLSLLIVLFVIYELTSIDTKYINKNSIIIDINNVKNPQVKKLVRFLDNYFGYILFKISKKKQEEFYSIDEVAYNNLPNEITVKAPTKNLTISNNNNNDNDKDWTRSHGNHSSNKFSLLKKINSSNVHKLDVEWTYQFPKKGLYQAMLYF